MKVLMRPHLSELKAREESGIKRVIENWFAHLPSFGVELVTPDTDSFDVYAVHISAEMAGVDAPLVLHSHGIYWSADYACAAWELHANSKIVETLRYAKEVTVPSAWVAETFQRDMRFTPHIIPHGIDWREWRHNYEPGNYVLHNKNRSGDVCDVTPLIELARRRLDLPFVSTVMDKNTKAPRNVEVVGLLAHERMKPVVQSALVYLSTTKETFGIGALEALASGVPVLGFAHGGNLLTVQHGVNGYLAQPGNFDDLEQGLAYCIQYRKELGANAIESVKKWTWEAAAEKVAAVYELALRPEPPTVAVIIPIFNKTEEQLRRAINATIHQTYDRICRVVVVDDGSSDGTIAENAVNDLRGGERDIVLLRQNNSGVANARNAGISMGPDAKYICCLDADDEMQPTLVEVCVRELEKDRSLGIAYTGLRWVEHETGRSETSAWPPQFDYNRQLLKQNQIPTCCVFRRVMWERLGGYNQKYAPLGCGAEDAEFWLRAGAFGWNAKKVTEEPLFLYSTGGLVGGNKNYVEPNWIELWPWAGKDGDRLHPFASVAKPLRFSHPVRQYDEPVISVIIPVGTGHVDVIRNALDSLEHQSFRKWEAVVVFDTGEPAPEALLKAYPYIRPIFTDKKGAGYARNRGVEAARAPFIVFLDADDWLFPSFMERTLEAWDGYNAFVYTDYIGKAMVDDPNALAKNLRDKMYDYDEKRQVAIIGYHIKDYTREQIERQPDADNPLVLCNITTLLPKMWHDEIGGFDESMPSWEDVDYYWRIVKSGKPYQHLAEELMVYQFYTGNRRETGRQIHRSLLNYLKDKHKEIEIMPCSSCGKRRSVVQPSRAARSTIREGAEQMKIQTLVTNEELVLCRYIAANTGDHRVIGPAGFHQRFPGIVGMVRGRDGLFHFDYGHWPGGGRATFLVHKEDLRTAPQLFQQVPPAGVEPPTVKPTLPPAPPELEKTPEQLEPEIVAEPVADDTAFDETVQILEDAAPQAPKRRGRPPMRLAEEPKEAPPIPVVAPRATLPKGTVQPAPDLQRLPGINAASAQTLRNAGLETAADILAMEPLKFGELLGIGPSRARSILDAIKEMTHARPTDISAGNVEAVELTSA